GRGPAGGKPGDGAEQKDEDQGGGDRLDHEPERPQDRLLVDADKVPLDQHGDQVTAAPGFTQFEIEPALRGGDDMVPFLAVFGSLDGQTVLQISHATAVRVNAIRTAKSSCPCLQ